MRTESCTGLGGSTQRLHHKEIKVVIFLVELLEGESDEPDPHSKGSR